MALKFLPTFETGVIFYFFFSIMQPEIALVRLRWKRESFTAQFSSFEDKIKGGGGGMFPSDFELQRPK